MDETRPTFRQFIGKAQEWHARGNFAVARELWGSATEVAANDLELGWAVRGQAASLHCLGDVDRAIELAGEAYNIHETLVEKIETAQQTCDTDPDEAHRHFAQSATVFGTFVLKRLIGQERSGQRLDVVDKMLASRYFEYADKELTKVEQQNGLPDQHRINLVARFAIAESLYGDQQRGKDLAWQAWSLGVRSESKGLPTSAELGWGMRYLAKARAVGRAVAASAVSLLATPEISKRRRLALWTADRAGVL